MLGAHKEVFQKVGDCMFHHPRLFEKFRKYISKAAKAGKKISDQRQYTHMYLPVRAFIEVFEKAASYTTLEEDEFAGAVEDYIRTIRYRGGKITPIAYKRFHAFFAWLVSRHLKIAKSFYGKLKEAHEAAQKEANEGAEIRKVILPEFSELTFTDDRPLPPPSKLAGKIKE